MRQVDRAEMLKEMYRAFNARDIDGVLAHLHPDVDWANGMTGGREHGRAAVRRYWEREWQTIDPRVEPLAIDVDPSGVAHVRVHQLVKAPDGAIVQDRRLEHVYGFDGAFVKRMDILDTGADGSDDEDDDA